MPRRTRPQPLPDSTPTGQGRPRVWCRAGCGHELTAPDSRTRGFGPTCDPEEHPTGSPRTDVDQDPLPGI